VRNKIKAFFVKNDSQFIFHAIGFLINLNKIFNFMRIENISENSTSAIHKESKITKLNILTDENDRNIKSLKKPGGILRVA